MSLSSALPLFHIVMATIGLLSGAMAILFRKGSGLHGAAGSVFFVSMLSMSAAGAYISAFIRPVPLNVIAGTLTFYLVATAWRAARRRDGKTGIFDAIALLWILAVAAGAIRLGLVRHRPMYYVFGVVALLCAVSDIRILARGGITGARRIARHLWRMCLGMLIATASLYPGQAQLFSKALRATNLLYVPHILLFGTMIFWMYRVSVRKRIHGQRAIGESL